MNKKISLFVFLGNICLLFTSCGLHNNEKNYVYSGFGIELYPSGETYSAAITDDQTIFPDEYDGKKITSIRSCADDVRKVELPNTIKTIKSGAFQDCKNLESIIIPGSVTSIGDSAFCGCSSLTSIVIPDSVTSIGEYTFKNCSSLESITIPRSVISIRESAFYYCYKLKDIYYMGAKEEFDQKFAGLFSRSITIHSINI